ncbi:RNA-binding S4 domain-containing protein [Tateyamaria omphalii]|uniref:RNA-binding protein S4 n=1 Tax=Tateyamaria omphalii TaxID=299262 RepID=A0A1P8MUW7_9RHOB|nr:RNA-binding S4 domain-containing protein [Tateyamaria omphalii]APX11886.1 RNA-binding protein S4 [Tateyamaria omphalii]
MSDDAGKLRLDKWLWFARFFKTRSLAATRVAAGDVRVNGARVTKRSTTISPGDVLTFSQGRVVRIIEVKAIGTRRGPAPEAQALYTDMSPPPPPKETPVSENPRFEGKGRPTKKDRRQADLSRSRHLE